MSKQTGTHPFKGSCPQPSQRPTVLSGGFHHFRGRGFTLIELMVASVIVSVALLGVFSLMRQTSEVEARSQEVWHARGRAESVADHLVGALKRAVVVSVPSGSTEGESEGQKAGGIQAGPDESGGFRLRVFVLGGVYDHGPDEPVGGTRWLEYRWFRADQSDRDDWTGFTAGEESSGELASGYILELRSTLLAGDALLHTGGPAADRDSDAVVDWWQIEPITLASGLDQIEIAFRTLPDGRWQSKHDGPPGDVLIRLRVRVADETVERIFHARAVAEPSTEDESSSGAGTGGAEP